MKITDIATNLKLREEYQAWRDNAMTKLVVDMVRLEGRIFMPRPEYIKSEIALAAMGENAGYHSALDRIMNLDKIETKQDDEAPAKYGADALMAEMYPGSKPKPETKGTPNA